MIGLGADVLTGAQGDARDRHLDYARSAGSLTMIVGASGDPGLRPQRLSDQLTVYPVIPRFKAGFLWQAYRLGAKICGSAPIDLIVTQDPFATGLVGYALKRRFGARLLISNHSRFLDNPFWLAERPMRHRLFTALGRRLVHRADGLRVVNEAERLSYLSLGVPPERVRLLPTPVSLAPFLAPVPAAEVDALRQRLGLAGRRALLWVGRRWEPSKDLRVLLGALSRVASVHPTVVLIMVGDLGASPELRRAVEEMALAPHVSIPGRVPHAELPVYYHLCEFYAHSSRYEGLAKVMVEAAAAGKAVVTTRIPGIEAVIEDGVTGLLAPVGDAEGLARRMVELLESPARATRMGEAARRRAVARFERDAMVEAIVRMWRDVGDGRGLT